jgi:hypothetical protein
MLQTYDYYAEKDYKGLDKTLEVPVQKAELGKIGIASGYTNLE